MTQINKFLRLTLMALLMVVLSLSPAITHVNAESKSEATITIKEKKEVLLEEKLEFSDDATALSLLKEVAGEEVVTEDTDYGPMITSIKGVEAEGTYYWALYVNGKEAEVGAHAYKPAADDVIEFRYQSFEEQPASVSLKVVGEEKNSLLSNADLAVEEGNTALSLLKDATGVETTETDYGPMIVGIDGLKAEGNYYWAFYVNGEPSEVGAGDYEPKAGDALEFKYESFEAEQPEDTTLTEEQIRGALSKSIQYILSDDVGSPWEAIAISQAGEKLPESYIKSIKEKITSTDGEFDKVTDYERIVLGLTAAGHDATNFKEMNFIDQIASHDGMTKQGLNGPVFALLAYDSGNYDVAKDAEWTREALITHISEKQLSNGAFSLTGPEPDIDMTAMAISALSPYYDQPDAKKAIDQAVAYLKEEQLENGGFMKEEEASSESIAEVVIALSSIGQEINVDSFIKEKDLLSYLLSFMNEDGGFSHKLEGESNEMSSAKGAVALAAWAGYLEGNESVYRFDNIEQASTGQEVSNEKDQSSNSTLTFMLITFAIILVAILLVVYLLRRKKA